MASDRTHRTRSARSHGPVALCDGPLGLMIAPAVNALDADDLINLVSSTSNSSVLQYLSDTASEAVHIATACTGPSAAPRRGFGR